MDIGSVINQYEVVEHIGRGGMADVWSARDRKLNRMVAIKTIAHGLSQDADPVGMFKQEAQTIAQMEHPHVLPIYDFGDYQGQLYIVMRYVAGGSLEDMLRRGPLNLTDALRLGRSIAQALDYAHANKVVHLDLKPPNVLLDSHQSPYLADFGLATVLDPEGKALNPGSGTLLYMAPEQLTSDVIDYRADLYSFAIVMFHMFTGELPFEGTMPLALRQMQFQDDLPAVESINPALPAALTEILRQATALNPNDRHESLTQVVDDLASVHSETALELGSGFAFSDDGDGFENLAMPDMASYDGVDSELLEAVDIYTRARHVWSGGNGRFLLGVTNFMVMSGYYMHADVHGLELDTAGKQMLLRGALEYDQEVDFWWRALEDDDRRWVCLHALRSGNAPARVRALYRLETLPDADTPVIPKLVAQMLQIERDENALMAALQVLGTRYKLMAQGPSFDVQTAYRGRLLTTLTRLDLNRVEKGVWHEVVYTPEIDLLIAEVALNTSMPRVADYAGRIIGQMRSTTAVRYIAHAQRDGRKGALRALAIIRDETPSLPPVVGTGARIYAWFTNTLRRMFDQPLSLILRFAIFWLAGWIAMGFNIYASFRSEQIFGLQRWGNTLAMGLMYGLVVAILILVVSEFSTRLRGFWPWWVRMLSTGLIGFWFGTLIWALYVLVYLQGVNAWNTLHLSGLTLMAGFWLTSLLRLRSYIAIPLTAALIYLPINVSYFMDWTYKYSEIDLGIVNFVYGTGPLADIFSSSGGFGAFWDNLGSNGIQLTIGQFLFAYDQEVHIYSIALPFAVILAIGGHLPLLLSDLNNLAKGLRRLFARSPQSTGELDVQAPLPVPVPRVAHTVDPSSLDTELDVAQQPTADNDTRDLSPVTEYDVNQGVRPEYQDGSSETDMAARERSGQSESKSISMGTGLRIEPKTERVRDEQDTPEKPTTESKAVSFGTGLKIEPKTERVRDEQDTPEKPTTESKAVSFGTGLKIEPKTERVRDEVDEDTTRPSSSTEPLPSKRVDLGTGINVEPDDSDDSTEDDDTN